MHGIARTPFACLVALATLVTAAPTQRDPFVEQGKQLVVRLHAGKLPEMLALRLSAASLAVAEATAVAVDRVLLHRAQAATIHVYADEAAFRAIEAQRTSAQRLREVLVDAAQKEAHVLLTPLLQAADLEVVGLPRPTHDAIVRATAALLAVQKSRAAVVDPWLGEVFGWAMLARAAGPEPKVGADPEVDTRRAAVGAKVPLRTWVMAPPRAAQRDDVQRHDAMQYTLARMLGGDGDWARRWLQNPAKPTDTALVVREAAVERVLGKDWTKMQARWAAAVDCGDVPFLLGNQMVQPAGKRWLLVGTVERAMTLFAQQDVPAGPYRIAATCARGAGSHDLRIQLDWDGTSLVGVFLAPQHVEISQWDAKGWASLAKASVAIAVGKAFDVSIEVGRERDQLVVVVDGEPAVRWKHTPRAMRGDWSIANNQGVAWVENLRVEAAQPK